MGLGWELPILAGRALSCAGACLGEGWPGAIRCTPRRGGGCRRGGLGQERVRTGSARVRESAPKGGPAQPPTPPGAPFLLPCAPLTLPQPLSRAVAHPRPLAAGGRRSGGGQLRSLPAKSPRAAHATALSPRVTATRGNALTTLPAAAGTFQGGERQRQSRRPRSRDTPPRPHALQPPPRPGKGLPTPSSARTPPRRAWLRTDGHAAPPCARTAAQGTRAPLLQRSLHLDGHAAAPAPAVRPPRTPRRCYPAPPARSPHPRRLHCTPTAPQIHPHAPRGWLPSPPAPWGPRVLGAEASRGAPSPACCPTAPMPAAPARGLLLPHHHTSTARPATARTRSVSPSCPQTEGSPAEPRSPPTAAAAGPGQRQVPRQASRRHSVPFSFPTRHPRTPTARLFSSSALPTPNFS